ncbi:alkaline phosphatase D family protein [Pseudoduganella ginsengisoli]|uniref:Alkaline phosphatase family protein n=1 Tax=Pseudoduganella ginsengisoli TaxID=1462440 RepID=A0A6L6Q602_9BURK|nr:alkaline phosphatase D family protein [Pseudoduganella ginsengisoli]MTW05313.1 alkaline phosphatase family protein [Pseudoduganella ginsengisoli]
MALNLGPILQFRGNTEEYLVSALVILDAADKEPRCTAAGAKEVTCKAIATIPFALPTMTAWRIEFHIIPGQARQIDYEIEGERGSFLVPAAGETPRIAYGSCNGYSDAKLMKAGDDHYERWRHLTDTHAKQPYHLLLMGGDQVYSDGMWKEIKEMADWLDLPADERFQTPLTSSMAAELDQYFCKIYVERWNKAKIAQAFRSIPTVMMWDDHDIMDGWGSYPYNWHNSPVYQGIFEIARRYFRLFQLQCDANELHPASIKGANGFHLGFQRLGKMSLLVPDLRSERQPKPDQIISLASWDAIYDWMANCPDEPARHLLVMSSIPVAYQDLGTIEKLLGVLPGQQELEDDLRDHWSSPAHIQERKRLVHRLFSHAKSKRARVTILSGDVHVGALSVIESTRDAEAERGEAVINQLISTGIVHPPPPALVRYVLETNASSVEQVDQGITATMQPLAGRNHYLIGARNWLAIEPDPQNRLWCNWHVEGVETPHTKVIHPVKVTAAPGEK